MLQQPRRIGLPREALEMIVDEGSYVVVITSPCKASPIPVGHRWPVQIGAPGRSQQSQKECDLMAGVLSGRREHARSIITQRSLRPASAHWTSSSRYVAAVR